MKWSRRDWKPRTLVRYLENDVFKTVMRQEVDGWFTVHPLGEDLLFLQIGDNQNAPRKIWMRIRAEQSLHQARLVVDVMKNTQYGTRDMDLMRMGIMGRSTSFFSGILSKDVQQLLDLLAPILTVVPGLPERASSEGVRQRLFEAMDRA